MLVSAVQVQKKCFASGAHKILHLLRGRPLPSVPVSVILWAPEAMHLFCTSILSGKEFSYLNGFFPLTFDFIPLFLKAGVHFTELSQKDSKCTMPIESQCVKWKQMALCIACVCTEGLGIPAILFRYYLYLLCFGPEGCFVFCFNSAQSGCLTTCLLTNNPQGFLLSI